MALPFAVSSDDVLVQPTRASLLSMLGELKRPAETVEPAERLAVHPNTVLRPCRPEAAPGVIFHSDRGCQYTSSVFDAYCTENGIRRSLGRTGICYDNAVSESFFATYKKELIHTRPWPTLANLEKETSDWIGNYYNPVRRHSTLGYLTPEEFELGYRQLSQLAA